MKPRRTSSSLTFCALTAALATPLATAQPAPMGPPLAVAPEIEDSPAPAVAVGADGTGAAPAANRSDRREE